MANGDDPALLELFARHALAGGTNQFTAQLRLLFACAFVGAGSGSGRPVQAARLWAAPHWHWHIAGLVIAAGVALITVPGPREPGRESGPAS